jgi:hypothetical protein
MPLTMHSGALMENKAENDPMPQGPFGVVVGQRPQGMVEHRENRIPVIQEFPRQFPRFFQEALVIPRGRGGFVRARPQGFAAASKNA